ncbi:MFS transporter [Alkalihalophilus marmarensis]|jgi:predicted MFS family arabinose efflux permease|uniref:Major Facilitator Superfamily protein n=1 Tax=Alkalihalophilus marmarensis DSM 21297 TaxID=1188261 RepID=U6SUM6_9BACI|nr:MFS transporter [Alkalihalophilus marmarensis]ERN54620.1 hypothetical protein A33I_04555 [Alkalihalophilus marmarensis DSM 21297]MCM3488842.1 MFS transporter [Alkalihalophilus marmarensis]
MSLQPLFKNKLFMKVFASYSISMFGIYFDRVAIFLLFAYVWQERPIMLAFIAVAIALPQVIISPFAGVFIEHRNKVKVMLAADFLTALFTFSLLFITNTWLFLTVLMLRSTIATVHFPAEQAIIKHIVPETLVLRAVSLNGISAQVARIIGPVIGATLAAIYSPLLCLFINGVSLLFSSLILLSVAKEKTDFSHPSIREKQPFREDLQEGLRIILQTKTLLICFGYSFLGFFALQMVDVQFPVLFRLIAPEHPELMGWIMSFVGIGSILIYGLMSKQKKMLYPAKLLMTSFACLAIVFISASFLTSGFPLSVPLLMSIILGIGVGLQMFVAQTVIQKETTGDTIARVSSLYHAIINVSILVAPLIGALLVELFSIYTVLKGSGILLLFIGSALLLTHKRENQGHVEVTRHPSI